MTNDPVALRWSEWADELKPASKEAFESLKEQYRHEWGKWER